ncbi:MAG TPA: hypothetical protein ACFCUD_15020 [Cyclobacteriaceae bacterium]
MNGFFSEYRSDKDIIYVSIKNEIDNALFVELTNHIDRLFGHLEHRFILSNFEVSKIRFNLSLINLNLADICRSMESKLKNYEFSCHAIYSSSTDLTILHAFKETSKGLDNYQVEIFESETEARQWLQEKRNQFLA